MPSYNQRLTANNLKIDEITALVNTLPDADEINEKIDAQDTIIENLKSALDDKAGKGGAELNVFTQLTEPTTKKGIWLQTDEEMEHCVCDSNVYTGGEWFSNSNIPYQFSGRAVAVGTNVYLLGSSNNNYKQYNYKYDTLTDTYTKMTDIPYVFQYGAAVAISTDIYIFGGSGSSTTAYKYNTINDTYTQLTNIPYNFEDGSAVAVGTDIYLLGSVSSVNYRQYNYKYDTLTDTYTKMTNIPYQFYSGSAVAVGTDIYLFGGSGSSTTAYKYNTINNSYTQLTNIPYQFYSGGAASAVGTNIYLCGGYNSEKKMYEYDTLTDTYTKMTDLSYKFTRKCCDYK